MKRSIKRLPKRTQEELAVLQELILAYFANVRMIILYGSYARGKYVIWDETYDEHGIITYYQSDLDILVICDTGDAIKAERYAREIIVPRYDKRMEGKRHPAPPSIIVETPATINRAIRRKHYFFYEIIKDGILLYDDGTFQIGKPEKLPYREIKQYAEEEYAECFPLAEGFLRHGHLDKEEENYKLGSFHENSRMCFLPILPKKIKRLKNCVRHILKRDTTDCLPLTKSNTSICLHEQRCYAK